MTSTEPCCVVDSFDDLPETTYVSADLAQASICTPQGRIDVHHDRTVLLEPDGQLVAEIPIVGLSDNDKIGWIQRHSKVCPPGNENSAPEVPPWPHAICFVGLSSGSRNRCLARLDLGDAKPEGSAPGRVSKCAIGRLGRLTLASTTELDFLGDSSSWSLAIAVSKHGRWFLGWSQSDEGLRYFRAPIDAERPGLVASRLEQWFLPRSYATRGAISDDGEAWIHANGSRSFWIWPVQSDPRPLDVPILQSSELQCRVCGIKPERSGVATIRVSRREEPNEYYSQTVLLVEAEPFRWTTPYSLSESFGTDSSYWENLEGIGFAPCVGAIAFAWYERIDYPEGAWIGLTRRSDAKLFFRKRYVPIHRKTDSLSNRCAERLAQLASADGPQPPEWWERTLPDRMHPLTLGFFDWHLRTERRTTLNPHIHYYELFGALPRSS